MTLERKRSFIINILYAAIICALIYLGVKYVLGWIFPFFLGLIVAFILQKPIVWLSKKTKMPRQLSAVIWVILVIILLLGVLFIFGYRIFTELSSLVKQIPDLAKSVFPELTTNINDAISGLTAALPEEMQTGFSSVVNGLLGSLQTLLIDLSGSLVSGLGAAATQLPGFAVALCVTTFATLFLSMDYRSIVDFFRRQVPERYQKLMDDTKLHLVNTILRLIRAYIILMLITFFELAVGFSIMGLEYAITIAAVTALLDMLPMIGTAAVLIPWIVISVILGDYTTALGLTIIFTIVSLVRNLLEPRIVGGSIGLHPVATLFLMYVGLQLLGLPGMFLFPISVIILKKLQDSGSIHVWN